MLSNHGRVISIVLLLLFCATYSRAQPCNRHIETEGGFSVCLPEGWVTRKKPDDKFTTLYGPRTDGFTPNVNFKDEFSKSSLRTYVAGGIDTILASKDKFGANSIESLGQTDFRTAAGLTGIRVVFLADYKGIMLRLTQYCFDLGQGRKLIITATGLDKNKDVFDPIFDQTAKSFRLQ
jgi:hypothetical protein